MHVLLLNHLWSCVLKLVSEPHVVTWVRIEFQRDVLENDKLDLLLLLLFLRERDRDRYRQTDRQTETERDRGTERD